MTYRERWNHDRTRAPKGHPKREARRVRATERAVVHVCGPTCKANRRRKED